MPSNKFAANYPRLNFYPTAEVKEKFLRDARSVLKATGDVLASKYKLQTIEIVSNRAGIAVSGDVYGYYKPANDNKGLFVQIGASAVQIPGHPPRQDGLEIMARTRTFKQEKRRSKLIWVGYGQDGSNCFNVPLPTMTPNDLAGWLHTVYCGR